jgi:hypothetical protein
MASLPLHQFTRFFRFFNDTVKVFRTRASCNREISICGERF